MREPREGTLVWLCGELGVKGQAIVWCLLKVRGVKLQLEFATRVYLHVVFDRSIGRSAHVILLHASFSGRAHKRTCTAIHGRCITRVADVPESRYRLMYDRYKMWAAVNLAETHMRTLCCCVLCRRWYARTCV